MAHNPETIESLRTQAHAFYMAVSAAQDATRSDDHEAELPQEWHELYAIAFLAQSAAKQFDLIQQRSASTKSLLDEIQRLESIALTPPF